MYVRSFFGVSAGASLCERKSTSDFPNPPASRPVSSESKKTNARTDVRAFVFWCVRRGSNPDRERRRELKLTPYVYFYAFSLISCIFLCFLLHNCSIFYVLQGVNSLAGVKGV